MMMGWGARVASGLMGRPLLVSEDSRLVKKLLRD